MYRNFKQSQRVLRENSAERKNKIQEFWKRNFEQDLSEKEVTRNYHDDEEAVQEERTKKKKKKREKTQQQSNYKISCLQALEYNIRLAWVLEPI